MSGASDVPGVARSEAGRREAPGAESRGGFPFTWPVDVRFRDIDAMGHAHHSLPLVYFEEARAALWRELTGQRDPLAIDYIMAEVTLSFRGRILWPQRASVGVRVARIGEKSFELEYELRSRTGELLTEGRSVQVMYDYAAGRSKAIPAGVRAGLERLAGEAAAPWRSGGTGPARLSPHETE